MTEAQYLLVAVLVGGAAASIALLVIRTAPVLGLIDIPNERSSHASPRPRGGGLGIVIALIAGMLICLPFLATMVSWSLVLTGAAAVAGVGFIDDLRPVSIAWRLLAHVVAGVLLLMALPSPLSIELGSGWVLTESVARVVSLLGVIWLINAFNFMDGIDGLAGSEAMFVGLGAAVLIALTHPGHPMIVVAGLLAAACAGFLVLNWPPARIFLGDVGSGFLGFVVAGLALWAMSEKLTSQWPWIILNGLFIVDATFTLVRRGIRGERIFAGHRQHAYQRLSRRWSSHRRVTSFAMVVNFLWLLPCAVVSVLLPEWAPEVVAIALLPIVTCVWWSGAGCAEES